MWSLTVCRLLVITSEFTASLCFDDAIALRTEARTNPEIVRSYWHKHTGETTWDRPTMPVQSMSKVGLKDLLKIKQVVDFFDLRNSDRLNRLV